MRRNTQRSLFILLKKEEIMLGSAETACKRERGIKRRGGRRNRRRRGQARPARWQLVASPRGRGNVVGGSTTYRSGSAYPRSADVPPDLFQLTLPPRVLVREVQRQPRRRAEQSR